MITADTGNAAPMKPTDNLKLLQAALHRYCLSITGSRWDAEDLVQDTWLKALGTLRGPGHRNAEAFLLRIAKNTWIDQMRRKNLLSRLLPVAQAEVTEANESLFELERAFAIMVKYLTPPQRAVFLLRDVLDFSGAETAKRLRMTEGAVKAMLRRARQALDRAKRERRMEQAAEPVDDGLKMFVRTLAASYRRGDIARLADLVQQDIVQPAAAIGTVQSRMLRERTVPARPQRPGARMAAQTARMSARMAA